jgi:hypothetical protein
LPQLQFNDSRYFRSGKTSRCATVDIFFELVLFLVRMSKGTWPDVSVRANSFRMIYQSPLLLPATAHRFPSPPKQMAQCQDLPTNTTNVETQGAEQHRQRPGHSKQNIVRGPSPSGVLGHCLCSATKAESPCRNLCHDAQPVSGPFCRRTGQPPRADMRSRDVP